MVSNAEMHIILCVPVLYFILKCVIDYSYFFYTNPPF